MRANRKTGSRPEVLLRQALYRRGLRYRKNFLIRLDNRKIRADVVFARRRVAVFVDGCFWHMCPVHGNLPRGQNAGYWLAKLARNVECDRQSDAALQAGGWTVVRVWEHEPIDEAAVKIVDAIHTVDGDGRAHTGTDGQVQS